MRNVKSNAPPYSLPRRALSALTSKKSDLAAQKTRWVTGATLRRMLNISAVTLWRWRHDPSMGFPPAKRINGRLYFPWHEVSEWLAQQQDAVARDASAERGSGR
jgi:predicted DNA-binding transcriptional regulator AlpA